MEIISDIVKIKTGYVNFVELNLSLSRIRQILNEWQCTGLQLPIVVLSSDCAVVCFIPLIKNFICSQAPMVSVNPIFA